MDTIHGGSLRVSGFHEVTSPEGFCPLWRSYSSQEGAIGFFHVLAPHDGWQIAIHDFTLVHDMILGFPLPEYLSVTWHDSIAGEDLTTGRRIQPKSLWGFYSDGAWRGRIRGGVPVRSVGIEVKLAMSRDYLEQEYGGQFEHVRDAFVSLSDMTDFPELRSLLQGLWPLAGDERRSSLYYEGKVLQAMGLIIERTRIQQTGRRRSLPRRDREQILRIVERIDQDPAAVPRLADLAWETCMSPTKFKESFRVVTGLSLTRYVRRARVERAEVLLRQPEATVQGIARAVGYSRASSFSEMFRSETGMSPSEYRQERANPWRP